MPQPGFNHGLTYRIQPRIFTSLDQLEIAGGLLEARSEFTSCPGSTACNYLVGATNAGYCDYPPTHYTCAGERLYDTDGDGVCDAFEVPGCTDPTAVNFYPWITESTAVCLYESDFTSNDCPEDLSGDGLVGTSDLLMLLSANNLWCPE